MAVISKIEVQKKDQERFNLYVDGAFKAGISIDTLVAFNLKKGDTVDEAQIERILAREYQQQANNQALNYLSHRKRTRHEIATHLADKDYTETVIAEAIAYCERLRLIDHEDYVESLKNTMLRTTDKGPEVFRQKLYKAGIEKPLIEAGVAQYVDEQPFEQIYQIAEKIVRQKKGPVAKVRQQVQQGLMKKGYQLETIHAVIDALDFEQDPEMIDNLLQRDLEKFYNKYERRYDGRQLIMKTMEALMRKGYAYDDVQRKIRESGIEDA
ncbi:RecX family transcriptional regulator [Staphylococcus microti]|uniref:Regulatory protein RecX n=1 Tax=Staphylococcus microti TaxID=569857 RepID=A0A0D6XTT1_9STAP|nr:recombination regulator RecX [Staphylococcus microti]KIX91263.1 RecX family transcriptional regulator [Staphylococcus microti]PNZ83101.1 recombination regulator RecX [Staphylococcus microti]SUM57882.1 regulatory protein RecX [Staphylococcus microti]